MIISRWLTLTTLAAATPVQAGLLGQNPYAAPLDIPAIRAFVGAEGLGRLHENAPAETQEFGRLVGVWNVTDVEMQGPNGQWVPSAPAVWVWKYTIDGFAVQDLFYQAADRLPTYMGTLGRDYMLTAMRIFDARAGQWKVAWMANGAGKVPGQDFGTFVARMEGEELIMTSPGGDGAPLQRVVFSDFTGDSFRWRSEYSADGGTNWTTVMRLRAERSIG